MVQHMTFQTAESITEVADTAREIYHVCFPYAERNAMKKQLVINTLSFEVHTEVYDGYVYTGLSERC